VVVPVDLSDERDVDRALGVVAEQIAPVEVLVNSAGCRRPDVV
jgi:short-subunit dehydrogenase